MLAIDAINNQHRINHSEIRSQSIYLLTSKCKLQLKIIVIHI